MKSSKHPHAFGRAVWTVQNALISISPHRYTVKETPLQITDRSHKQKNANQVGVYYWNKKETLNLCARAGVQFPSAAAQDGLIHTIQDGDSPVNRKFMEQTETKQFRRWFGDSKVVDEDGKPLVVYHGSDADFDVFDMTKERSNMDIQGAFFSPYLTVSNKVSPLFFHRCLFFTIH